MILLLLILNLMLWTIVGIQLNLYNTDSIRDLDNFQVNCLNYYIRADFVLSEKVEYCLGLIDINYSLDDVYFHLHGQSFTFAVLSQLNVTTKDLLLWSSPIDVAEQYQYYLEHRNDSSLSTELFFNCTKSWFGPRCQFSFDSTEADSFERYVKTMLKQKFQSEYPFSIINLPCYTHLTCTRGSSQICLDWREICDGRIDCIDDGVDEQQCLELEINQCNENEFRCYNGQCIPKEFLEGFMYECSDKSDIKNVEQVPYEYPNMFDLEEYTCTFNSKKFVCGNGTCVKDFDQCLNKRHLLLIESIISQGNLSYRCWITMICLTKILDQINGTSCQDLLTLTDTNILLESCDDLIQFPIVPVLFGHIYFLYDHIKAVNDWNIDQVLIPDYICYDNQLCDFLIPTYRHENLSCRRRDEFTLDLNVRYQTWSAFIDVIETYFRKCLIRYNNSIVNTSFNLPLYCCKNSSKCISKYRILDNVSDCYLNDDEEQLKLDSFDNDVRRFNCPNENLYYAKLLEHPRCLPPVYHNFDQIEFGQYCDRQVHIYPVLINGQNHTDETDCEQWPCNNFYTRCDGFWSCPNGTDEENCTTLDICPLHSLVCLNPHNYTLTCLSANQVNDGHIDCLGATDEREHCRKLLYIKYTDYGEFRVQPNIGFRCLNNDKCLELGFLCDAEPNCPEGDDEKFCTDDRHLGLCYSMKYFNLTDKENTVCSTVNMLRIRYSLETSPIYPRSNDKTIGKIGQQSKQQHHEIRRLITNDIQDPLWLWQCNHGLYVRHWLGGYNYTYKCFCPPSYYGDRCQYQNQRISLTMRVKLINRTTVYEIIVNLIDDNDASQQIISYHQYTSINVEYCEDNFNTYLTYATRPKNNSANYSVRIDIYNKTSLAYLNSWYYQVPFSFLPVNRMAVVLYVPAEQVLNTNDCPLLCDNGKCMKYMNKVKFYCQCNKGWSGIRCHIPIYCNDCLSDSICIGFIHNRSICICPYDKGGPRCLLTRSCENSPCQNNGTCLTVYDKTNINGLACICPRNFDGNKCEKQHTKLEISFFDIKVSSILLIYIFVSNTVREALGTTSSVIAQKPTMFQRTVLINIQIPFHMALVKTDGIYYLAVVQHSPQENMSTSIDTSRRCRNITEIFNREQLSWHEIRRIKYYHQICQAHWDILCFVDDPFLCLCTIEHHANCMRFDSNPPKCHDQFYCQNNGMCLQDMIKCASTLMCSCSDCYFGDRCQFYAKGIGLTLDDILRYELRPNVLLSKQSAVIQWSIALTTIIFVGGLINSILSLLTFTTKKSRDTGCGIYLIASSITSILTVSTLTMKFWFVILTQMNSSVHWSILQGSCRSLEFILKTCLYMDNWLNACVAIERAITVAKGVSFNKKLSKRIARWTIFILLILISVSIIHEPLYRDLFEDKHEQRSWCVFLHVPAVQIYNTIIILIHFIGPFLANIFSAIFIIIGGARRKSVTQKRLTYHQHLRQQFEEHKNLIISPVILVILGIPGLIISMSSGCVKISYSSWFYLFSYLLSFIPSMTIFVVFVLPSEFYKEQFKESIKSLRRRQINMT